MFASLFALLDTELELMNLNIFDESVAIFILLEIQIVPYLIWKLLTWPNISLIVSLQSGM